jgi:uncharacterized protein YkwD
LRLISANFEHPIRKDFMNAPSLTRTLSRAAGFVMLTMSLAVGCAYDANLDDPLEDDTDVAVQSEALTAAEVETLRAQVLVEINKARAVSRVCGTKAFASAPPLRRDSRLDGAAQAHSVDMATRNYFSHYSQDGRTPFDRMRQAGYSYRAAAENIAAGNSTAVATVQQWLNSPGHCANLMSATYVDTGIGYGYSQTSTYKHYWTQKLARPL